MNDTPHKNHYLSIRDDLLSSAFPLFCFPYAGGGGSIFFRWKSDLSASIQICPIQLPGRESRIGEQPFDNVASLIPDLADCLDPYLNQSFAFFGHSMGALIAYELARELRRREKPLPIHLFVSGRRAPQIPSKKTPIHRLPDADFLEELRILEGTPEEVLANAELIQLVLPALRADFALCETYRYQSEEPFDFPITAFAGIQDADTPIDDIDEWRTQTRSSFILHKFPGNHFFLHEQRRQIVSIIHDRLGLAVYPYTI